MGFEKINSIEKSNFNVFDEIGKKWLLITVFDKEKGRYNAMTASWGCAGVLWNKNVCIIYVRPQRHTFTLLEESDTLSLNVLKSEFRGAHKICGSLSGRDTDKIAECGLTVTDVDGTAGFEQSETVLTLRVLYSDDLREECFKERALLSNYNSDYHRAYICEITGMYRNA